ncbi:hypothetical protein DASC09_058630 [Saccharomycopsis crataegensis]|uniref:DUF7082 domain-containing protein n=1 Tax=Saccharomycopsis crataegensis TaxID=43959 RepID=A0AAV5QUQ2_9ASCO|nr:hypothetical protein DASC09_058630 [Saccharomycopsis crataegensis]
MNNFELFQDPSDSNWNTQSFSAISPDSQQYYVHSPHNNSHLPQQQQKLQFQLQSHGTLMGNNQISPYYDTSSTQTSIGPGPLQGYNNGYGIIPMVSGLPPVDNSHLVKHTLPNAQTFNDYNNIHTLRNLVSSNSDISFDNSMNLLSSPEIMSMGFSAPQETIQTTTALPSQQAYPLSPSPVPVSNLNLMVSPSKNENHMAPHQILLPQNSIVDGDINELHSIDQLSATGGSDMPSSLESSPVNISNSITPLSRSNNRNISHNDFVTHYGHPTIPVTPMTLPSTSTTLKCTSTTLRSIITTSKSKKTKPKKMRIVRGLSSGGSSPRPPKNLEATNDVHFVPVRLSLENTSVPDLCLPEWSNKESADKRRIIRIERYQDKGHITAKFSILGSDAEHPKDKPLSNDNIDVLEVSCLECFVMKGEDDDEVEDGWLEGDVGYGYSPKKSGGRSEKSRYGTNDGEISRKFYITSVEVVKLVELLICAEDKSSTERRKERGRIRSNLVPFWSKRPISTRMSSTYNSNIPIPGSVNGSTKEDFRIELAKRIMGYSTRKPRGFDKEVRILKWEKLEGALRRALMSYYVEIPKEFR